MSSSSKKFVRVTRVNPVGREARGVTLFSKQEEEVYIDFKWRGDDVKDTDLLRDAILWGDLLPGGLWGLCLRNYHRAPDTAEESILHAHVL